MVKANSGLVRWLGYASIGLAALIFIEEHISRFSSGSYAPTPTSVAIGVGDTALAIIGIVALAVAQCLKNLEDRLSRTENIESPKK